VAEEGDNQRPLLAHQAEDGGSQDAGNYNACVHGGESNDAEAGLLVEGGLQVLQGEVRREDGRERPRQHNHVPPLATAPRHIRSTHLRARDQWLQNLVR